MRSMAVRVSGEVTPPGDKSITHRALILSALASGTSRIERSLDSEDTRATVRVLEALGVEISPEEGFEVLRVRGRGLRGLEAPAVDLDCGNSGTLARLITGVLAAQRFSSRLVGDQSLSRRPMRRVTVPLSQMGARFDEESGDGLPLTVHGAVLRDLEYQSPVASAQVKSALILAALTGGVNLTLSEPSPSRDHTESLLSFLEVPLRRGTQLEMEMSPVEELPAFGLTVPGDFSSASFLVGAALLASRGELLIKSVGLNPTRTGALRVWERMGAGIEIRNARVVAGEEVGDLWVHPSSLRGTVVTAEEIPSLIDEIPILAVLAARAEGETRFEGAGELRRKESDRLVKIADNLMTVGSGAEVRGDDLIVTGSDAPLDGSVDTGGDHRIAMAFTVLARATGSDLRLSETKSPAVSYPGFTADLDRVLS